MTTLTKTTTRMQQAKEEFKNIRFAALMVMLCNSPFAIAKYISCLNNKNMRPIRSFLSYAITEEVFDSYSLL